MKARGFGYGCVLSTLISLFAVVSASCKAVAREIDLNEVGGADLWGGRRAQPAVVNPVTGQDSERVLSLRGEWDFSARNDFVRNTYWGSGHEVAETGRLDQTILVPGSWEAQGVGAPGMSDCWNVKKDCSPKLLRHVFKGVGFYRRSVEIPSAWSGCRIWLKVGGVNSVGWFYANGSPVACVDSYCGTYKYEITDLVVPGSNAVIAVQVRNDVPSRKGLLSNVNRWGGIYRDIELEATPRTYIDDAWVRGDFDKRLAEAHVEVAGLRGLRSTGADGTSSRYCIRASVEGETVEKNLTFQTSQTSQTSQTLEVPLRHFRAWSPEHPNLYTAKVELVAADGTVLQTWKERFGVRKLEVRGKEFYLNDKPFYFRGFGDDFIYPLTGFAPADVGEHRRRLGIARAAGFNYARLHTHCEIPEYFEAADEMGIIVQPELPYYNDEPTEGQTFDPVRDVTELWRHYRRYPSFGIYSMGNEGSFRAELDRALHRYVKAMDPDRLKINQDCHVPEINPPDSADFVGGPIKMWDRGSYDPDRPFVNHEYLNLGIKQDSRLESRYVGVWQPPETRAHRDKWLAGFNLGSAWGDRLQDAQHVLQSIWRKRGIECARTDPYCDGFCYWTIVDVVVAFAGTYTAQGLFNPFWEQKSCGDSAADVLRYNRPVGVFADLRPDRRVFAAGERVAVDMLASNYGDGMLHDVRLRWHLSANGRKLASGEENYGDMPLGGVRKAASIGFVVPELPQAEKAEFRLALEGRSAAMGDLVAYADNVYDLWLFPFRAVRHEPRLAVADVFAPALSRRYAETLPESRAGEADIVIAPYGSALAADVLARGQRLIALNGCWDTPSNVSLGWWAMDKQVGVVFERSPVFARLPHQGVLNELFFRIVKEGRALPSAEFAEDDILAIGEGGGACYLYLARVHPEFGTGLMAFGLDVLSETVEGAALLDGMIDFVKTMNDKKGRLE